MADAIASQNENVERLSEFLEHRLFDIGNDTWVNLSLTDKDWPHIKRLRAVNGHRYDRSYLNLTLGYIEANADRVSSMYAAEASISRKLITDGPDAADIERSGLSKKDQQSLFASRLACALHHSTKDQLVGFFSERSYSDWIRKRFLYPFIYYFINRPPDEFIDYHLSHLLPPGYANPQERAVIEFLLRDELAYSETLSFKCYIALVTHPYDACEILLNHCEAMYASTGMIGESEVSAVAGLVNIVPRSRQETLPALFGRASCLSSLQRNIVQDESSCFPSAEFGAEIDSLLGVTVREPAKSLPKNRLMATAIQIRDTRYPRVQDYDTVVSMARAFWFTSAGRLLGAYLTSLYLLPRRERAFELRELFRLAGICGGVVPLLATAPRGFQHLMKAIPTLTVGALIEQVTPVKGSSGERNDRLWLSVVQFELSVLEHSGHFKRWLQKVFDSIPVAPGYLTGIDWDWFAGMLKLFRIGPFRGSAPGIYTLLLQYIEGRRRETNTLRIAIEDVAKKAGDLDRFLSWCITTFGERTVALVRYFLTADMILWLQLERNYVAALGSRMRAIEICVRKFDWGPMLSEETLLQEERIYTAALLAINVGANQFEISWDILKKDVGLAQGDVYNAYLTFNGEGPSRSILTLANQETDYHFAIGPVARYSIINRDWPLLNVIAGIIDTFMEHPTQGIESVLAIRIRHNMLRREFLSVVAHVKRVHVQNVSASERKYIAPKFEAVIGRVVQSWIDRYMHQRRVGLESAVFDFVPSQTEITGLIDGCRGHTAFGQTFDAVAQWIRAKLDNQLHIARTLLTKELRSSLETEIERRTDELQVEEPQISSTREIGRVLIAAVNQQADKLVEWFRAPLTTGTSVAIQDLWLAVGERFQAEIDNDSLVLGRPVGKQIPTIRKNNVRMVYDLWCEVVLNAIKHSGLEKVRVRVSSFRDSHCTGLVFSSNCTLMESSEVLMSGHPYASIHDALFSDVQSGLAKVVCLSASIVGSEVRVRVVKRSRYFHLVVPLENNCAGEVFAQ
jgi:hypothetical protein